MKPGLLVAAKEKGERGKEEEGEERVKGIILNGAEEEPDRVHWW